MKHSVRWALYVGAVALYLILVLLDAYTTYLITPDLKWEGNPAVTLFGGGWPSLIAVGAVMVVLYAVFAYLPLIRYTRPDGKFSKFSEFYSTAFGKRQKKKPGKLVPVGVIIIFAGIFSRIYVITIALLSLNGYKPCFFCAIDIPHSVCNNAVIKIGSGRILLPVVMFTVVGVLTVISYTVWLRTEYKKCEKDPAGN